MAPSLRLQSTSGETRDLSNGGLEYTMVFGVDWLPDGESIVFSAKQPGRPERLFVQSVKGTPPRPVTPEGVSMIGLAKLVSPDGKLVVGLREGVAALYPLDGGEALPIPGLLPGDLPTQWTNDGRSLFIFKGRIPRARSSCSIGRPDKGGFSRSSGPSTPARDRESARCGATFFSRDGQSYVHTYSGWLSDLFVLEGLK